MKGRIVLVALLGAFIMSCEDVAPPTAESIPPAQQAQLRQYRMDQQEEVVMVRSYTGAAATNYKLSRILAATSLLRMIY